MSRTTRTSRIAMLTGAALLVVASVATLAAVGATRGTQRPRDAAHVVVVPDEAYAEALFDHVAIPSGATRISRPVRPLSAMMQDEYTAASLDLARFYLLPASFDVDAFATAHVARSLWLGTGSGGNSGETSTQFALTPLCTNRHATSCTLTYTALTISSRVQELRVDVNVVWMPIDVVLLPLDGVVRVTGYDAISVARGSRGPVTVVLNKSQVHALRVIIASLRESPGGACMENAQLYRLSVTSSSGTVIWSAANSECPGTLTVTSGHSRVTLSTQSCPLSHLIASFFPAGTATSTRADLATCPTWW